MIEEMIEVFKTDIQQALIDAEIGDFTIKPSEKASKEILQATRNWMGLFVNDYVKSFNLTYALCPKVQWDNYKLLGLNDLPEILLLKEAKEKLVRAWKSRPTAIRRTYYDE